MHICTCSVMIAGDVGNIMVRGPANPVSWPEIGVLQFLHGEEAIFNISAVRAVKTTGAQEKQRLGGIYNPAIVDSLYPGKSPVMELEMPGTVLPSDDTAKSAKITRRGTTTTIPPLETAEAED